MESYLADKIIKEYHLVPSNISKKICNFLVNTNSSTLNSNFFEVGKFIEYEDLLKLKKKILNFKSSAFISSAPGRNNLIKEYIFFLLKRDKFISKKENIEIFFNNFRFKKIKISLSSYLLDLFHCRNLIFNKNHVWHNSLDIFLKKNKHFLIDKKNKYLLAELLKKKKIIIFSPVCPNYSYVKKKNNYVFTFKTINNGPGLVAETIFEHIKTLFEFLSFIKKDYKYYVSIGDFEAFSIENQRKLSLSEKDYLNKARLNQKHIQNLFIGHNGKKMFTEYFGGKSIWVKKYKTIHRSISRYFTKNKNEYRIITDIIKSRKKLYFNWYKTRNFEILKKIVIKQGAEYATMAYLLQKKFGSVIILGADHHKMSFFYQFGSKNISTLYIKKKYAT